MKLNQLSIFLENKAGRINEVANVLSRANINMYAFSLSENNEFGIMRIIVSDYEKALLELRNNNFMVSISDVICMKIEDVPGAMANALDLLTPKGIIIEYMYAFSHGKNAYVILRTPKIDDTITALSLGNIKLLSREELVEL